MSEPVYSDKKLVSRIITWLLFVCVLLLAILVVQIGLCAKADNLLSQANTTVASLQEVMHNAKTAQQILQPAPQPPAQPPRFKYAITVFRSVDNKQVIAWYKSDGEPVRSGDRYLFRVDGEKQEVSVPADTTIITQLRQ